MTPQERIRMYDELLNKYIKQWKKYKKLASSYHEKANHTKIHWVDETMKKLQQAKNELKNGTTTIV